jgi:hypothetical protein
LKAEHPTVTSAEHPTVVARASAREAKTVTGDRHARPTRIARSRRWSPYIIAVVVLLWLALLTVWALS